jgi:NAD(P)-dependent dehydrogenase (short-subunit alcohol dehydrogenase family)
MVELKDFFSSAVQEHRWKLSTLAVGGALAVGGFLLLRKWVAGGVCRSQARLDRKTVIITGANTGIGLETAVDLAKRNARVILACRSVERGETAAVEVRKRSGNDNVVFVQLDLASLDSVREFAAKILEEEPRIDILINNAGLYSPSFTQTTDGIETTFAVNHLGHFLLTNLLLDRIKEAPSARIVNVSALAYIFFNIDFNDLNSAGSYKGIKAYGRSKLANILFTRKLAKELQGTGVTVNALHPGGIYTNIFTNINFVMVR